MLRKSILVAIFAGTFLLRFAIAETGNSATATFLSKINVVDAAKSDGAWSPATVGQRLAIHDRVRTGEDSRAATQLSDASILHVDELSTIEILPPKEAGGKSIFDVKQGALYFFSRGTTHNVGFQTPAANGAIRGTEFLLGVSSSGKTTVTMLDGRFDVSNSAGSVALRRGQLSETERNNLFPGETAIMINCEATDAAPWHLLIEMKLPSGVIMKRATESELLAAIAAAVKRWREFSPEIVKTAIVAHKEWAAEIVRQAITSLGKPHDCALIGGIISGAIAAAPDQASRISEIALRLAPECHGTLENLPPPGTNCPPNNGGGGGEGGAPSENFPANINPPPGSSGGGAGRNLCIICHNGHDLRIPCDQVASFVRQHPGDFAGSCRPTPVTNQ